MVLLRWILGFALTLLLVLALAIVFLPSWFEPNDYRDDIEAQISQTTGREIALNGDLQLSVFPWLGVRTEDLRVSQPSAIGGDFIRVDAAQIRLQLMPLLSRQAQLDTVYLESPTIHFIKVSETLDSLTIDGNAKDSVAPQTAASPEATSIASDGVSGEAASNELEVSLSGIEIQNGSLLYDDRLSGSRTRLDQINASVGDFLSGTMAPFSMDAVLVPEDASQASTNLNIEGQAAVSQEGQTVIARNIELELNDPEQRITAQLEQLDVKGFAQFDVRVLSAKIQSEELASAALLDIPVLSYNLDTDQLRAKAASLKVSESRVQLSDLVVNNVSESPKYSANINIPEHALATTLKDLGVDFQPSKATALQKVALQATFNATDNSLRIADGRVQLDSSNVTLSGSVTNFDDPNIELSLNVDQLNLDDYLPADTEGSTTTTENNSIAAALAVPMAVFEGYNAKANLSVAQLTASGIPLSDVSVDVKSDKSKVSIMPKAKLFSGSLGGDIAYSQVSGIPTLRVKNEIDLVSIGDLLTTANITDQLAGIGSLVLDLVITERDGRQFNEGTIKVLAKEGKLQGVNVKEVLEQTYAQYKGLQRSLKGNSAQADAVQLEQSPDAAASHTTAGSSDADDQTQFANLIATLNVKDFRITNTDLELSSPLFKITGAGVINLNKDDLDYTVNVAVNKLGAASASEAIQKLSGLSVPIRFTGALKAPSFSVDTNALYRSLVRQELNDKKGALLQEKLGIEGAGNLSTKETLKQVLLNELLKPKGKDAAVPAGNERPMSAPSNSSVPQSYERPMGAQTQTPNSGLQSTEANIEDSNDSPEKPLDEEALKQELAEKLLEELFK